MYAMHLYLLGSSEALRQVFPEYPDVGVPELARSPAPTYQVAGRATSGTPIDSLPLPPLAMEDSADRSFAEELWKAARSTGGNGP